MQLDDRTRLIDENEFKPYHMNHTRINHDVGCTKAQFSMICHKIAIVVLLVFVVILAALYATCPSQPHQKNKPTSNRLSEVKGTMVTARRDEQDITRNASMFKNLRLGSDAKIVKKPSSRGEEDVRAKTDKRKQKENDSEEGLEEMLEDGEEEDDDEEE